ncbi:MAG: translational GTPase TypA [Planctomycetota bacterium]|jgi:GTP-binding protein
MTLRNVAIIAHVDHGKTTLVDAMLSDAGVFREGAERVDCVLDSNPLERERGITVLSKNVAVQRGDLKVNIIDTPGHADFGGEVERVLRMADGALLLVDAFDGPMPQTRYVLGKALALGLRVVVVINKCDRRDARPTAVLEEVFDLFVELGASDVQLDFPVLYASGREGWVRHEPDASEMDTAVLFDAIEQSIPAPEHDPDGPARLQVTTMDHNDFVGRIAIGRVDRGHIREGQDLVVCGGEGEPRRGRVAGLFLFTGLDRRPVKVVEAGDLVAIHGFPEIHIGETLCDPDTVEPLASIAIDEPTISMEFAVNDSPFGGTEGSLVNGRQIAERLQRELRSNVALAVESSGGDSSWRVSGRGVLHLGILIETMRREGYELSVSRPRVIDHWVDGERLEPVEELTVDVPGELAGKVIETVCARRGDLLDVNTEGAQNRLRFHIPARGLIGLRTRVMNLTGGEAVLHHILHGYEPFRGKVPRRSAGVMASTDNGAVAAYALDGLVDRGTFFVKPTDRVYEGMIVGEHCKSNDIAVNVCREKKLTNMRTSGSDRALKVVPPRHFSLEDALEYIEDDELVEVTPKSIRLRKKLLNALDRKRADRAAAEKDPAETAGGQR